MGETARAPGIVNLVIGIFLNFGAVDLNHELPIIPEQEKVCKFLLFIAVITPPWMLFVKPLLLWRDDQEKQKGKDLTSRIEMTAINQESDDIEERNDLLGGSKSEERQSEESELKIIE